MEATTTTTANQHVEHIRIIPNDRDTWRVCNCSECKRETLGLTTIYNWPAPIGIPSPPLPRMPIVGAAVSDEDGRTKRVCVECCLKLRIRPDYQAEVCWRRSHRMPRR